MWEDFSCRRILHLLPAGKNRPEAPTEVTVPPVFQHEKVRVAICMFYLMPLIVLCTVNPSLTCLLSCSLIPNPLLSFLLMPKLSKTWPFKMLLAMSRVLGTGFPCCFYKYWQLVSPHSSGIISLSFNLMSAIRRNKGWGWWARGCWGATAWRAARNPEV